MDRTLSEALTLADLAAAATVWGTPYVAAARLRLNRTLPRTPFARRIDASPGAALNNLGKQRRTSDPRYRAGVGVSTDTLYTSAWLDLGAGPFVLETPRVDDRYYSFQFALADTSSDMALGSRTHGAQLPPVFICGPEQRLGDVPADAVIVHADTRYLNLPGRMLIDPTDPADLARAHAIQDQIRLRTLEQWRSDRAGTNPVTAQRDISPPDDLHPDLGFLHSLGEVLRAEHLRPADMPLVEQFADIGLTVTSGFDGEHLSQRDRAQMLDGVRAGRHLIDERCEDLGVRHGGWSTNLHGPRFDGDHLLRAAVARDQIYVTIPEEGIYPLARNDADGEPLTGSEHYRVHFRSGTLPPVAAFWSITLYDDNGFLVPEADGRWAVGDRTAGLVRRDGSATIGIGPTRPPGSTAWLPTPAGRVYLMMRLFCPLPTALDGTWQPPAVERVGQS